MVKIENKGQQHCVGSLINHNYVLTAASCIDESINDLSKIQLLFGISDINTKSINRLDRKIKKVILHPDYKTGSLYYGVGLIQLSEPIEEYTNFTSPICLPAEAQDLNAYYQRYIIVAGFGKAKNGDQEDPDVSFKKISYTVLPPDHHDYCDNYFFEQNSDSNDGILLRIKDMMPLGKLTESLGCAHSRHGDGTCQGDTGLSYLLSKYNGAQWITTAIGVSVHGQCGDPRYPDLYVRLDDPKVLDWINEIAF